MKKSAKLVKGSAILAMGALLLAATPAMADKFSLESSVGKNASAKVVGGGVVEVALESVPKSIGDFESLKAASQASPFDTAALFIAAILAYPQDPKLASDAIDKYMGPAGPMGAQQRQFLKDRMAGKAEYIGKAYVKGAGPQNNYEPDSFPYVIKFSVNGKSFEQDNIARIFVHTDGADSPRPITLRYKPSEGKWYLFNWDGVLVDVKKPVKADPWA